MRYRQGLWAILIICSALAALGAMLVLPDGGIRPFIVAWFLFVCPGMAIVQLIPLKELVVKLMLALALSFSIDGLVAGTYLYANRWAPREIMFTLTMFSIVLVVVERTHAHRMLYQHVAFVQRFAALLTHPMIIGTGATRSLSNQKSEDSDFIDELSTIQLASATIAPPSPSAMNIEDNPTLQLAVMPANGQGPLSQQPQEMNIEDNPTLQLAAIPANEQGPLSQQPQEETNQKQLDKMLPGDMDIEEKPTVGMPAVTPKQKNQFLWPLQKGKLQQSSSSEDHPVHEPVPATIQPSEDHPAHEPVPATIQLSEDQPVHEPVPAAIQPSEDHLTPESTPATIQDPEGEPVQPKNFDFQAEPPQPLDNQIHAQALDPAQPGKSAILPVHENSPIDQTLPQASEIKPQHAPPPLRRRRAKMVPLEK